MKHYIFIIIILLLGASCNVDDFLDVKPTGVVIPETVEDFDKLMNNPYSTNGYWKNLSFWDPDVFVNAEMYSLMQSDKPLVNMYKWSENIYTGQEDDRDWNKAYENIYVYNTIINGIDNAPLNLASESDRLRVKGEAYGQRAMDYFLLACEYAPAYSVDKKDELAIPMHLEADITKDLPKSTIGEVFEQILADLKVAETALDNSNAVNEKAKFRPGIAGIKGMLALVSLHMGDFPAAKAYSNEALALYDHLYDYNTLTHKTIGDAWSGLNIDDFKFGEEDKSVIWDRKNQSTYSYPYAGHLYHPDLLALFDQVNDQRFSLFSSDKTYASFFAESIDVSPNFAYASHEKVSQAGLTVANLILVNAESCIRDNDPEGAVEALNKLLVNRINGFTPLELTDFADNASLLNKIKEERRKELMATGNNVIDLKRYHALGETIPTFTRVINSETYTLEPGSSKYQIPIPLKSQLLNPNL